MSEFATQPHQPLQNYILALENSVRDWGVGRSLRRYMLIRNILTCYPELQDLFDDLMKSYGHEGGLNSLLYSILPDEIGTLDAAMMTFEDSPMSLSAPSPASFDLVKAVAGEADEVSPGAHLYYSASLKYLRKKLMAQPSVRRDRGQLQIADVDKLRGMLQRPNAVPSDPNPRRASKYRSVNVLRMVKKGLEILPLVMAPGSERDPETGIVSKHFHAAKTPMIYGPYLDLPHGVYILELVLSSSKELHSCVKIGTFGEGQFSAVHIKSFTSGCGRQRITFPFPWNPATASAHTILECQFFVTSPAAVDVELHSIVLSAEPCDQTVGCGT